MYIIIWEFIVEEEKSKTFEDAYGVNGGWVTLFRHSEEYKGTSLLQDSQNPRRYLTIDRWVSKRAYDSFRESHAAEYRALDDKCATLTTSESIVGTFKD